MLYSTILIAVARGQILTFGEFFIRKSSLRDNLFGSFIQKGCLYSQTSSKQQFWNPHEGLSILDKKNNILAFYVLFGSNYVLYNSRQRLLALFLKYLSC